MVMKSKKMRINKKKRRKSRKLKGGTSSNQEKFLTESFLQGVNSIQNWESEGEGEGCKNALKWVTEHRIILNKLVDEHKGESGHSHRAVVGTCDPTHHDSWEEQQMSDDQKTASRERRENDQNKIIELNELFREIIIERQCATSKENDRETVVQKGDVGRKGGLFTSSRQLYGFYKSTRTRGSYFVLPLQYKRSGAIRDSYPNLGSPPSSKFSVGSIYSTKSRYSSKLVTVPTIGANNWALYKLLGGGLREITLKTGDNDQPYTSFLPEDLVYVESKDKDEDDDYTYDAAVVIKLKNKTGNTPTYEIRRLVKSWSRVGQREIISGDKLIWIGWSTQRNTGQGVTNKKNYISPRVKKLALGVGAIVGAAVTGVSAPISYPSILAIYAGYHGFRWLGKAAFGAKILRPKIPIMVLRKKEQQSSVGDSSSVSSLTASEEFERNNAIEAKYIDMNKHLNVRINNLLPGKGLDCAYANAIEVLSCNENDRRTRSLPFGPRRIGGKKTKKHKKKTQKT